MRKSLSKSRTPASTESSSSSDESATERMSGTRSKTDVNKLEDRQKVIVAWKNQIIKKNLEKIKEQDDKIESLERNISKITEKLDIERKTSEDLRSDNLGQQRDISELKETLENTQVNLSNLEDDCVASAKEIKELHSKIVDQANELDELKRQNAEKAGGNEVERISSEKKTRILEEKIDKLTSVAKTATDALIAAQREEKDFRSQIDEYKTKLAKKESEKEDVLTSAHRNIESLKMEKMQLMKDNSTLRENLQKITEPGPTESSQQLLLRDTEITSLKEKLEALEKDSNDALCRSGSRLAILQNQVNEYKSTLEGKENAMTVAYRNIETLKSDKNRIEKKNISLEEHCATLKSELESLTASRDSFASKVSSFEQENSVLIDQRRLQSETLEQMKKLLDEEKAEREAQQIELETEKANVRSSLELMKKNEEAVRASSIALKNSNDKCQKLAEDLKSFKEKEVRLLSQNSELVLNNNKQVSDHEKKIRALEEEVRKKENFIKKFNEEMKFSIQTSKLLSDELREKDDLLKHYEEELLPVIRRNIFDV